MSDEKSPSDAVIVGAARTPVGRGRASDGYYSGVHASTLLGWAYTGLLERVDLDPARVDDIIAGCGAQIAEQGRNIARNAWLEAGLPCEVPAITVDRQCGSAQSAVNLAASLVSSGTRDVVLAAGVEHMGHVSFGVAEETAERYGDPFSAKLRERFDLVSQGISAEMVAERWSLTRAELDGLALTSHRRAAAATAAGRFEREVIPVEIDGKHLRTDQGIRPDTSLEALAKLKAAFKPDGVVTAGNSSQISDGAAAVLVASRGAAEALGLPIRARIVDHVAVGVDPVLMLTGPIPATQQLLARNGMALDDVGLFEINEAFASVLAAWQVETGADMERVNVNGGAIALGHPLGSTGARLVTSLLHELERTNGGLGLVAMCCAGGIGTGTLVEVE